MVAVAAVDSVGGGSCDGGGVGSGGSLGSGSRAKSKPSEVEATIATTAKAHFS
jgi:hypothetical protein